MGNTSFVGENVNSNPKKGYDQGAFGAPTLNRRGNSFNHRPGVARVIARIKAYFIVRGVKSALKEVDLIEKGVRKAKSLDQLLNEL